MHFPWKENRVLRRMDAEKCLSLPYLLGFRKCCSWTPEGFLYLCEGIYIHTPGLCISLAYRVMKESKRFPPTLCLLQLKQFLLLQSFWKSHEHTGSVSYGPATDEITVGARMTKEYLDFYSCHRTKPNPQGFGRRKAKCELWLQPEG